MHKNLENMLKRTFILTSIRVAIVITSNGTGNSTPQSFSAQFREHALARQFNKISTVIVRFYFYEKSHSDINPTGDYQFVLIFISFFLHYTFHMHREVTEYFYMNVYVREGYHKLRLAFQILTKEN